MIPIVKEFSCETCKAGPMFENEKFFKSFEKTHKNCPGFHKGDLEPTLEQRATKELENITIEDIKKSAREIDISELPEKPILSDYAELIMKNYKFRTLTDTKEILYYQDGVYVERGDILISSKCERLIPQCSKHEVNEIIAIIQRRTFTERTEFNQDLTKLVLENGIFNLDTKKLSEHDPNFLTTVKIPIVYQPGATCFDYIKFLKECLDSKDIITVVEEASNVLTTNNKNFEVSAIWLGNGANGKTTNMNIINGVYGHENCSHVSIHDMGKIRFAVAQLYGRLLNSYADISNEELNNLGMFKQLISGDAIQAEKKNKDPFNFTPYAKHFFSANEMPQIKDNSDGTFRRIYLTKWKNQFLPGVNRITDLDKKILAKEKSGIFNLFFENYRTLIRNDGFRYKQNIGQVREIMKIESDKLMEVINVCLIKNPNGYIIKEKFYEIYVKYCESKSYEIYPMQNIGAKLPTYGVLADSKKINGKTTRIWKGYSLNIKDEWVKTNIIALDEYV